MRVLVEGSLSSSTSSTWVANEPGYYTCPTPPSQQATVTSVPLGMTAVASATAHDRRLPHFPSDDRRVAVPAALIGGHTGRLAQNRLPVWIGAHRHQQITIAETIDLGRIVNRPGRNAAPRRADRATAAHRR